MGQVNYNLSISVWIAGEGPMECRHWHSAADQAVLFVFCLQVTPSALDEMKSKILIKLWGGALHIIRYFVNLFYGRVSEFVL